jgi:hypothetical protein
VGFLPHTNAVPVAPTPALPEVGEFSGTRFPEMEVRSWRWIAH